MQGDRIAIQGQRAEVDPDIGVARRLDVEPREGWVGEVIEGADGPVARALEVDHAEGEGFAVGGCRGYREGEVARCGELAPGAAQVVALLG